MSLLEGNIKYETTYIIWKDSVSERLITQICFSMSQVSRNHTYKHYITPIMPMIYNINELNVNVSGCIIVIHQTGHS